MGLSGWLLELLDRSSVVSAIATVAWGVGGRNRGSVEAVENEVAEPDIRARCTIPGLAKCSDGPAIDGFTSYGKASFG